MILTKKIGDQLWRFSGIIPPERGYPPLEDPVCNLFEEYTTVLEMVPLEFSEGDVPWVVSKLSGATGDLGAGVIEIRNWIIHFGCIFVKNSGFNISDKCLGAYGKKATT